MTRPATAALLRRARKVLQRGEPLPLDLVYALQEEGIDVTAIPGQPDAD